MQSKTGTILKCHLKEKNRKQKNQQFSKVHKLATKKVKFRDGTKLATKMVGIGDSNVTSLFTEPFE